MDGISHKYEIDYLNDIPSHEAIPLISLLKVTSSRPEYWIQGPQDAQCSGPVVQGGRDRSMVQTNSPLIGLGPSRALIKVFIPYHSISLRPPRMIPFLALVEILTIKPKTDPDLDISERPPRRMPESRCHLALKHTFSPSPSPSSLRSPSFRSYLMIFFL